MLLEFRIVTVDTILRNITVKGVVSMTARTLLRIPTLTLSLVAVLLGRLSADTLIPAPGDSAAGYYLQFSDETTMPAMTGTPSSVSVTNAYTASAPSIMSPGTPPLGTPWQPQGVAPASAMMPTAMPTGGCNDCGDLWAGACSTGACGTGACGTGRGSCDGVCDSGCGGGCGLWAHTSSVYGSVLYLRPRNADVAYAVPIDGPIVQAPANNPIQIGQVGVLDPDYEMGFMAGTNLAINCMTSIFGELTMFDSSTSDTIGTAAPDVLRSIVSHPSSTSAATDFLSATSHLDINFDTVDVGIRHLFVGGQYFAVNYLAGARYSRLEQQFNAMFVDNGTEEVSTEIDFDGAGLRLGLEAERQSCRTRLRIYTRSSASFLAGRFRARYFQGQSFDPSVVDTNWEAGRVVPVLDLELGAGWSSPGGRLRLSGGYMVSAWFNTVKTEEFIHAVQQNHFLDLGDTLTFDGLRASAEWRF